MIEHIKASLAAQARDRVKVIEGTIEPTAVEATASPALEPPKLEADTAVGSRELKRNRKVALPPGA